MALDGITLHHLVQELAPQLAGARIDKITQPEKEEIHLQLRSQGQSYRLLLNISATAARLHLSQTSKKNPASPPMLLHDPAQTHRGRQDPGPGAVGVGTDRTSHRAKL